MTSGHCDWQIMFQMSTLKLDFASHMTHLNFWTQWDISLIISVLNTHNIITYKNAVRIERISLNENYSLG